MQFLGFSKRIDVELLMQKGGCRFSWIGAGRYSYKRLMNLPRGMGASRQLVEF